MVSFGSKTYSKRLLHLVSWSHWFTFFNIIAAILLSSFYLFSEAMPETLVGKLYLVTTWFSHMGFLTFIGFVLLIFPLTLIYPKTRFIRVTASIVFTAGLLLLLLDAFIYSRLGYHLNASSIEQILALIQTQIQQNSRLFWFVSLLLFFAIFSFQLVLSNYAWKHLRELQKTIFARFVVIGLVSSFFISHTLHIWADASLDYDILRQDTVLPLSYPSTAKTLLTKYGMFDKDDYLARRTSSLSFTENIPDFPSSSVCPLKGSIEQSTILVLTDELLNTEKIKRFSQRSSTHTIQLTKHIDNALPKDALFNLLYGLPSIYQQQIIDKNQAPMMITLLNEYNLASSLTIVGKQQASPYHLTHYSHLFSDNRYLPTISELITKDKLQTLLPGLHVFFFTSGDHYQYELFIDALLLSQRNKAIKDNIWISSIGNKTQQTSLSIKPALLILPNEKSSSKKTILTSQMDLSPTLMKNWLNCSIPTIKYSAGNNIVKLNNDRIVANTMSDGIMVFSKDKSVYIDQNGNFQSYSRQLEAPIMISADFPLMIDGVNFIKHFALQNDTVH